MTVAGLVVAAGSGVRFGGPKHLVEIAGRPTWQHSRDALRGAGVDPVVVVGDVTGGIAGGARRRDSVLAGLTSLPQSTRWVVVHDAARPAATVDLVTAVITRLQQGDVAGVVPAVAVNDTVKRVSDGLVTETLPRGELVLVQTPQGFSYEALLRAHAEFEGDASDDASMVEAIGGAIAVIPGEAENIKLTFPSDVAVLERLMEGLT